MRFGFDWGRSYSLPAMRCCNGVLFQGGHGVRFALVRSDCVLPLTI